MKPVLVSMVTAMVLVGSASSLPGSDAGRDWGVERQTYADPVTQVQVWEMTRAGSTSDNLYFHFSNFTADNRYLIGLMSTASGEYRTVITQGFRIGHVQHSSTEDVIFYVWETGGYAPQRTWLVQTDGTRNRPFYARTDPKTWFTPLKEWVTHEAWVKDTGEMTMINDKQGVMLVQSDGSARMVGTGDYWHSASRHDGKWLVLDDARGRLWLLETATGNTRLLATGLRDGVRSVHPHPSFDRAGHYVQFHTGRVHETVALIDLTKLPPALPETSP